MKIMSIDLGKVRTGIAICDRSELLASPLKVIEERDRERLANEISELALENGIELIVVGLPKNMDGSEGDSAKGAREFVKLLGEKVAVKVDMYDERGTTITAHNFLNVTDTRGKKRKSVVDSVAATIILQDYINYRKNNKAK